MYPLRNNPVLFNYFENSKTEGKRYQLRCGQTRKCVFRSYCPSLTKPERGTHMSVGFSSTTFRENPLTDSLLLTRLWTDRGGEASRQKAQNNVPQ